MTSVRGRGVVIYFVIRDEWWFRFWDKLKSKAQAIKNKIPVWITNELFFPGGRFNGLSWSGVSALQIDKLLGGEINRDSEPLLLARNWWFHDSQEVEDS